MEPTVAAGRHGVAQTLDQELRHPDTGLGSRDMLVERMRPFTSTIFTEISRRAVETGAINLGQGFPDTDGPASLLADTAANITERGANQYPPGPGVPELRRAVADFAVAHNRAMVKLLDAIPLD